MAYIKLQNFSGISPRTSPTLLQSNQAQTAANVKLQSGELRSWRQPIMAYSPSTSACSAIYKLIGTGGATRWLEWDSDVDIVSGPVADSTDYRIYYTSNLFGPKKTNWALATTNGLGSAPFPNNYYEMGVPSPTAAPTLSAFGGTAPAETRAYVYTYVNTFGSVKEESAPSPAATISCNASGSSVTVSGFSAVPSGRYNFTAIRIYRSVTGSGSVNYQFVAEIPITTSSYSDTLGVLSLGITLPSLYYTPPPSDLRGLVSMPNGMLAGFRNNEVWFCEPYLPHAWPSTYVLTTEFPIVGLGVFDTTLVVTTTKNPYLISGTNPSVMTQTKLAMNQPCTSKRSIAYDQNGVVYASPNGLVAISSAGQQVVTQQLYTRDEWQALFPSTMLGVIYNNMYIGFHPTTSSISAIVLSQGDTPPIVTLDFDATAVFVERTTGNLYGVSQADNKIYQLDADQVNNTNYTWQSKKFVLPSPTSFGAFKAQADFIYMGDIVAYNAYVASIQAINQSLSGSPVGRIDGAVIGAYTINGNNLLNLPILGVTRSIAVYIYADGALVYSGNINNQEPARLPAGFKAYVWEVRMVGNAPLRSFVMASTIGELKQVTQA